MSNDPTLRVAPPEPTIDPSNDPSGTATSDTSRRTFLQYLGAGVAVASLPALPGCSVDSGPATNADPNLAQLEEALAVATWIDVLRKEDLLSFQLGLVNMSVVSTPPPAGLVLQGKLWLQPTAQPAYLVLKFQAQHITERAFGEQADPTGPGQTPPTSTAPGGTYAVQSRIANPSQLVFVVPSNVTGIPFELQPLLTALTTYALNVAPNALPQPQQILIPIPVFGGGNPVINNPVVNNPVVKPTARQAIAAAIALAGARRATRAFSVANPEASPHLLPEAVVVGPPGPIRSPLPPPIILPVAPTIPVQPSDLVTQIELPFRLIVSPNQYGQFTHSATADVLGADGRIELWHTSLSAPQTWQQTIRALWTRDFMFDPTVAGDDFYLGEASLQPFQMAMYDDDRGDLVHLTTNYTLLDNHGNQRTAAVPTNALRLSTLGGWLDAHGKWGDPPAPTAKNENKNPGLVGWDHTADMGRDNYVRVVRAGYLYPYGHFCVRVRVTERKFDASNPNIAYLWQREYLIVKEPLRTYSTLSAAEQRGIPFASVRFKTLVTPTIDAPGDPNNPSLNGDFPNSIFVQVGGQPFEFEVEAFDQEGNKLAFATTAIWIDYGDAGQLALAANTANAAMANLNTQWQGTADQRWMTDLKSQRIAYAQHDKPDDTRFTTAQLGMIGAVVPGGVAGEAPFIPLLAKANLAIDAIRGITGSNAPQPFSYSSTYLTNGFDGNLNIGEVLLTFLADASNPAVVPPKLDVSKQTGKSGGFANPSLQVNALSRSHGLISGDPKRFAAGGDSSKDPSLSGDGFNPSDFFDALGANLFGCVPISGLIKAVAGPGFFDQAPKFLTQALQPVEEVLGIASNVSDVAGDILNDLNDLTSALPYVGVTPLPAGLSQNVQGALSQLQTKAGALGIPVATLAADIPKLEQAVNDAVTAATSMGDAVSSAITAVGGANFDSSTLPALATTIIGTFNTAITTFSTLSGFLTPSSKSFIPLPIDTGSASKAISTIQSVAAWMTKNGGTLSTVLQAFLMAEDAVENLHIKLDWAPTLAPWPSASAALFWPNDLNGFQVGVEIRGKESGGQPAGADVFASLNNFELRLLGTNPVMKLEFDHLIFKAGTDSKPDVDCVFNGLHFAGALSFVEVLRQFIPLDGFSDPPGISVTAEGITASFDLPLPNIALGMFSLENLSFSAGFEIPFIGKSLSVNFAFCSRESPFVLTVSMLGGGGFVGLALTPQGIQKLEISLEATACLAIDFGIASGSISISVGIYLCIESGDCKLTGFVKFNGQVEVLAIISASIMLDLELSYESATGKVVGQADLEISVSILCFSVTVSASVQRKFAGSNTDPTFRDIMAPYPTCVTPPAPGLPQPVCTGPLTNPWDDYVAAFVPLGVAPQQAQAKAKTHAARVGR